MVPVRVDLKRKVREDPCEARRHPLVVIGVAKAAQRKEHGSVEMAKSLKIKIRRVEGLEEGGESCRSFRHPVRRRSWSRWRRANSRLQLEPREPGHEFLRWLPTQLAKALAQL